MKITYILKQICWIVDFQVQYKMPSSIKLAKEGATRKTTKRYLFQRHIKKAAVNNQDWNVETDYDRVLQHTY